MKSNKEQQNKMLKAEQIREILSLYNKHDWNLRIVLLSDKMQKSLASSVQELFKDAEIESSQIDAIWFSRPSRNEKEAWEIRLLSPKPFALVETFDKEMSEKEIKKIRNEMETKLLKISSKFAKLTND